MPKFTHKTVFITGASAGIGLALAKRFAQEGASLALFARRLERLEKVATEVSKSGTQVLCTQGDVTQPQDLVHSVKSTLNKFGKLDVVIANAGFGVADSLDHLTIEDYRRQFETNVFGVLNTIYAALDALKESKGTLVLVGSVAGYVGLPGNSAYSMSKAAVNTLAESLHFELKAHGVSVVLISPGFVESEIRMVDNQGVLQKNAPDPIPEWIRMPSDQAAKKILDAVYKKRHEAIITSHGKAIVWLKRFFPGLIRLAMKRGLRARKEPKREVQKSG